MRNMLFLALITTCLSNNLTAQVFQPDSLALIALYNSTDGENWTVAWDLNMPVSNWFGIVIKDKRVTEINLGDIYHYSDNGYLTEVFRNNLIGEIPTELITLDSLKVLNLSGNVLSGKIPIDIGDLKELRELNLGDTWGLTGEIPDSFTELKSLEVFDLRNQYNMTGCIPEDIGNLKNLRKLNIEARLMSCELPSSFYSLDSLEFLSIRYSGFSFGEEGENLGNLKNLEYLDFSVTDVKKVPTSIKNLTKLKLFNASENKLNQEFPFEITALVNLEELYIYSSHLFGELPSEINDLVKLKRFNLSNNNLDNLPTLDLKNLNSSDSFHERSFLFGNKFEFDDILSNIDFLDEKRIKYYPQQNIDVNSYIKLNEQEGVTVSVQTFDDGGNIYKWFKDGVEIPNSNSSEILVDQQGVYHATVANNLAPSLTLTRNPVYVSNKGVTSADSLALVSIFDTLNGPGWECPWKLEEPVIFWNGISVNDGKITEIILRGCDSYSFKTEGLQGSISEAIGELTDLEIILIFGDVYGAIPSSIGNLKKLKQFKLLRFSPLEKSIHIPNEFGTLESLEELQLNNNLSGEIPETIGDLANLKVLDLHSNSLSGAIPTSFKKLSNLTNAILYSNNINDINALSDIESLKRLYIKQNNLDFEDLIPFAHLFDYSSVQSSCWPQNKLGEEKNISKNVDYIFLVADNFNNKKNSYSWFKRKEDRVIPIGTGDSLKVEDSGTYFYEVSNEDFFGASSTFYLTRNDIHVSLPVSNEVEEATADYQLNQNYPNPFNPATTISYSIKKDGVVNLSIYNIMGQKIRTLINERKQRGTHRILFNANGLPSGIYFYQIISGDFIETKKMHLIK